MIPYLFPLCTPRSNLPRPGRVDECRAPLPLPCRGMALLRTLAWLCLVTAASGKKKASGKKAASVKEELRLTSLSFTDGGEFPSDNLGDEDNISPNLAWTGAPKNTQSFVLIMDSEKPGKGKPGKGKK